MQHLLTVNLSVHQLRFFNPDHINIATSAISISFTPMLSRIIPLPPVSGWSHPVIDPSDTTLATRTIKTATFRRRPSGQNALGMKAFTVWERMIIR